jgi:hypothetical protein
MVRLNQQEGRYRVLLVRIGNNTEEEKDSFCQNISKNYNIPLPLLKKIVDRCPIVLKKNLSLKKAESLAKTLKSFGGMVSVEERRSFPPIALEFQELVPHQLALESSYLRKTPRGLWSVIGRAKNISDETLMDTWALIQLFEDLEEFITFEEAPLPINPLPSGETSPFKVIFEGDLSIKKISIVFKNASGQPIPAVDRRKKREWVQVEIEGEHSISSPSMSAEFGERSQAIDLTEPTEKMVTGMEKEILEETTLSLEQEAVLSFGEEVGGEEGEDAGRISEESLSLTLEPSMEVSESSPSLLETNDSRGEGISERTFGLQTFQELTPSVSEEREEEIEEESDMNKSGQPSDGEVTGERPLDGSVFAEASQLLEDISGSPGEVEPEEKTKGREEEIEGRKEEVAREGIREGEEPPSFSWIEYFRDAVENFCQKPRDIFSIWFEECRKEGEFQNSLHPLLTILVHARFDQGNQPIKVLENTQRVFRLVVQSNLLIDELPPLEGTPFVSGGVWRDLFHRALPKIQQIGNAILEKNKWTAFDLEQFIQVIPHMGHPNSRRAIRWIKELIPDVVEIDFSDAPITVGESLYRVASRLGIVDPHFDYYQGRNSMGDIKIQSFAKMAFPQSRIKVEELMDWVGGEEERGGHCFPVEPRCEGCLFETFCPRLYVHINPSEKGMRE